QAIVHLLGLLLKQILSKMERIPTEIHESFGRAKGRLDGGISRLPEILHLLTSTLSSVPRAYICIDALDEFPAEHRPELLSALARVVDDLPSARLFITGRPDIRGEVERCFAGGVVAKHIELPRGDIERYLGVRLAQDKDPEAMDEDLEVDIIQNVLKTTSENELETRGFYPKVNCLTSLVLGYCQGLLTLDEKASTLRLRHFTLRSYLCNHLAMFDRPHSKIAGVCLTYLNSNSGYSKRKPGDPLLGQYASSYWVTHARRQATTSVQSLALKLLTCYRESAGCYVDLLREKGELNGTDSYGSTPLVWASRYGNEGVVNLLLQMGPIKPDLADTLFRRTPLSWAAERGHERIVQLLLAQDSVDPNAECNRDYTPLHWAAKHGDRAAVKLLLERGDIKPDSVNKYCQTPLALAARYGHEAIVKLLLERGDVDRNALDDNSATPLIIAVARNQRDVAEQLLGAGGVDPNQRDAKGRTSLHWGASTGNEPIVKLLLKQQNADPNSTDIFGQTPLSRAAQSGHGGVVKILLGAKGINPCLPDNGGRTPLEWAQLRMYKNVVRLLQEH
ncbi:unnamed protein product, partial [Tuber aestivum]